MPDLRWQRVHTVFRADKVSVLGEIRKTLWQGNLELSSRYNYTHQR